MDLNLETGTKFTNNRENLLTSRMDVASLGSTFCYNKLNEQNISIPNNTQMANVRINVSIYHDDG